MPFKILKIPHYFIREYGRGAKSENIFHKE
jgi:hypothetical protein